MRIVRMYRFFILFLKTYLRYKKNNIKNPRISDFSGIRYNIMAHA